MFDSTSDETDRLLTLHSLAVLDSEPNPAINGIAKAAAGLCEAPIALVTLIDEKRQWFKANYGLDDVSETLRCVAFCDHAIRECDVMTVEDTLLDDRFKDNPLVVDGLRLRFYAGAPLIASNGARLGTLCVVDKKPQVIYDVQKDALSRLAESVVEMLYEESATRHSSVHDEAPNSESQDRAAQLVEHAFVTLFEHGAAEFSVRKVAKAADISLSSVQHHFPRKAALVLAIVDGFRDAFKKYYKSTIANIANPIDRMVASARYALDMEHDHRALYVLRELTALASRDPRVALALTEFYRDCRKFAAQQLQEANPDLDDKEANLRACAAVSLISGAPLYTQPWIQEADVPGFSDHVLGSITRLPFRET